MVPRLLERLHSTYPLPTEFGVVTALMGVVFVWRRVAGVVVDPLATRWSVPAAGALGGLLFVVGIVAVTGAYAGLRDVGVGVSLPSLSDLPAIAVAGAVPVLFVGVTAAAGTLAGVPYGSLTKTSYAQNAPVLPVATIAVLGLAVSVPSLVAVCQVLVQSSFRQVAGPNAGVVTTTLVAGFFSISGLGRLTVTPEMGKLVGAGVAVLVSVAAALVVDRVGGGRWEVLPYVPLALLVGLVVVSGVLETESLPGALFGLTHLAVLGVAAATYERTGSVVAPALAYLSVALANGLVVLASRAV
jgi:hypothetical protein